MKNTVFVSDKKNVITNQLADKKLNRYMILLITFVKRRLLCPVKKVKSK